MTSIRHVLYIWRWWLIAFVDTRSLQIDNRMLPAAGTITYRWLNPIRLSYMHALAAYCAPFHNDNDTRRHYFFSTIFYWSYSIASFKSFAATSVLSMFTIRYRIELLNFCMLCTNSSQKSPSAKIRNNIMFCAYHDTEYFAKLWKWKHIFECICSSIHPSIAL